MKRLTAKQLNQLKTDLLGLARHCLEQKSTNELTINEDNLLENIKNLGIDPIKCIGRIDNSF